MQAYRQVYRYIDACVPDQAAGKGASGGAGSTLRFKILTKLIEKIQLQV